jgi:TPR repeat protein
MNLQPSRLRNELWLRLCDQVRIVGRPGHMPPGHRERIARPQDYLEAVKWFRRAADQDDPVAELRLGMMYLKNQGVPQDFVQAHKWFNLSAVQGVQDAVTNRDEVARRMTAAQIAEAQRLAREWKPR